MSDERWGDPGAGRSGWSGSPTDRPPVAGEDGPPTATDTIDLRVHEPSAVGWPDEQLWSAPQPAQEPRGRGMGPAFVVLLTLIAAALGGGVGAGAALVATRDERRGLDPDARLGTPAVNLPRDVQPGTVAAVAARLIPSVVSIDVGGGSGSGVIIRDDGYIVTNNHVVAQARGPVTVQLASGRELPARVVGTDPLTDLAVLKVEGSRLPPAAFGQSRALRVGDPVVAIGSPLGLAGTVTSGIVSALNRQVGSQDGPTLYNLIQTDAAINPGNSGGALADAAGNVVGINVAIASLGSGNIGLGFAIPIDEAAVVAEQLIRTGRAVHPYLGVAPETVEPETAGRLGVESGVLVFRVFENSPASEAGLREGDVITSFGGEDVASAGELIVEIRRRRLGEVVEVVYFRDGQRRTAAVTLAERPRSS
jgi:putative serine protease PepD